MEIQSGDSIQDTIHNLYTHSRNADYKLSQLLDFANHLVFLFNEHEISNPGQLSVHDYQLFLLAHLIILDMNNARFLWKRIPKSMKDKNAAATLPLRELWAIGKALTKKEYSEGFRLIDTQTRNLQQDSEKNGSTLKLMEVLVKLLREEHIIKMIKKAYSTVELVKVKALLGMTGASDDVVKQMLSKKDVTFNGSFIETP